MWNGSIPIDFTQMTTSDLWCYKKTVAPQVDGATPHRSVAKESPNLGFFSPNLGVYKFTWLPVPALWKKWGVFLLLKNFGGSTWLENKLFCGTYNLHISNFWSRKRGTVSVGKMKPLSCNIKVKAVGDMVGIGHSSQTFTRWWFQIFLFSPLLGEMIQFD